MLSTPRRKTTGTTHTRSAREHPPDLYAIEAVDDRSQAELDRRRDEEVRKIRSYVFEEDDDTLGTVCFYEVVSPEVIRDHGDKADVGLDEIRKVTAIDVHRPEPERYAD